MKPVSNKVIVRSAFAGYFLGCIASIAKHGLRAPNAKVAPIVALGTVLGGLAPIGAKIISDKIDASRDAAVNARMQYLRTTIGELVTVLQQVEHEKHCGVTNMAVDALVEELSRLTAELTQLRTLTNSKAKRC